jgi:hypothetical protein
VYGALLRQGDARIPAGGLGVDLCAYTFGMLVSDQQTLWEGRSVTGRNTSNKTTHKANRHHRFLAGTVDGRVGMGQCARVVWTREVHHDAVLPEPIVVQSLSGEYWQVKQVGRCLAKVKGGWQNQGGDWGDTVIAGLGANWKATLAD